MARNLDRAVRAALAGRRADGRIVEPDTGRVVEMTEARRVRLALSAVRSAAALQDGVSDQIPVAPARSPAEPWRDIEAYMTENGPRIRRAPIPAGAPLRVSLPLERIEAASRRRKKAGPLFSVAQHQAAAEYEALYVRVHGGRVKCADLVAERGGGDPAGVMDAIITDIQRLRRMNMAIGVAPVLTAEGRAAQPGRRTIRADLLTHWVLIRGETFGSVLQQHGWSVQTRYIERLRAGLGRVLDRLHGL